MSRASASRHPLRRAVGLIGLVLGACTHDGRGAGNALPPQAAGGREDIAQAASDRLRVLMVTPRSPLSQGGVERHVLEVSRRLAAAGVEIEVLCSDPQGTTVTEQLCDGVVIRTVPAWPAKRDYYLAPQIWREMARKPWDIVHVQSYHTFVAPLAMLRARTLGIPYIVTFHGGGHSSRMRHSLRWLQRRALRPLLVRAERLVAVARFEVELYGSELRLAPGKFALIPNGTDFTIAHGPPTDGARDGTVLASIGRLERYKGHQLVVAALPHVLEQRPDARLLVVGTGPYEAALRRQAAELDMQDRVEFMSVPAGDRTAMSSLLQQVSLVVLLSEFETHPLVALEAAAAGRRLLVADRAGLREVADDGLARAISPADPPRAIARAILQELERPEPTRARRLPTWDECAADLLAMYRTIV